jgi:hypothetical protein
VRRDAKPTKDFPNRRLRFGVAPDETKGLDMNRKRFHQTIGFLPMPAAIFCGPFVDCDDEPDHEDCRDDFDGDEDTAEGAD